MTEQDNQATGKGRPTPSRKQQQAARKQPLVGAKSPEALREARAKEAAARKEARAGAMRGEERYLPARDKGPQRRMARDIVDSRFNFGELVFPVLMVVVILQTLNNTVVLAVSTLTLWLLMAAIALDGYLLARRVNKRLAEKYGAGNVERGLGRYVFVRSTQPRMLRIPKPQIKRGEKVN
jgi:hypothetical protein